MKKYRRIVFLSIFLIFVFCPAFSGSFEEGKALFMENRPLEAIPLLESSIRESTADAAAFVFLSLAYYQTGQYGKALSAADRGLKAEGADRRVLAFNAGNSAFAMGDYGKAADYYSYSIRMDPVYAPPVLNRANAQLQQNKLQEALDDYAAYLTLEPNSEQRPQILQVMDLIRGNLASATGAAAAGTMSSGAVQPSNPSVPLTAEQAEAIRKQQLLEDVAASLGNTETQSLSAGAEGVMEYEHESELD